MAGSLFHSREFRAETYVASNGTQHHEIVPVDGDRDVMSYSSWTEAKQFGATLGIPDDAWPDFTDFEFTIDIPLAAIVPASEQLRTALARIDRSDAWPHWFARIVQHLDAGEHVFFC